MGCAELDASETLSETELFDGDSEIYKPEGGCVVQNLDLNMLGCDCGGVAWGGLWD